MQKRVLKNLLETAKDTLFTEAYTFETILLCSGLQSSFAKEVPYFDYDSLHEKR